MRRILITLAVLASSFVPATAGERVIYPGDTFIVDGSGGDPSQGDFNPNSPGGNPNEGDWQPDGPSNNFSGDFSGNWPNPWGVSEGDYYGQRNSGPDPRGHIEGDQDWFDPNGGHNRFEIGSIYRSQHTLDNPATTCQWRRIKNVKVQFTFNGEEYWVRNGAICTIRHSSTYGLMQYDNGQLREAMIVN